MRMRVSMVGQSCDLLEDVDRATCLFHNNGEAKRTCSRRNSCLILIGYLLCLV
jgi:hypothetical protein